MLLYVPFYNIMAGLLAGLLCALGGAFKDAPFEGFKPLTFLRSPLVGVVTGWLTALVFPITGYGLDTFFVCIMCAGWLERLAVEGWKIMRGVQPGKFSFGDFGDPIGAFVPVFAVGEEFDERERFERRGRGYDPDADRLG